ncbi:MAG: caspase family protein [Armatimonadota bacterium]
MCISRLRLGLLSLLALGIVTAWVTTSPASAATPPKGKSSRLIERRNIHFTKPAGAGITINPAALPRTKGTIFSDGFESSFPGSWVPYDTPYFAPTTYRKFSGAKSAYCAQGGTGGVAAPGPYPNSFQGWITYGPFSTEDITSGKVTFKLWNLCEENYDRVFAGWSLDDIDYEGSVWTGNSGGWITAEADMTSSGYDIDYTGQSEVYFSFYFKSDISTTYEGAYIDDVAVTSGGTTTGTQNVSGTVRDQYGRPVQGAVVIAPGGGTAYTDWEGKYLLKLAPGAYTLTPRKPGCTFVPTRQSITVAAGPVISDFRSRAAIGDKVVNRHAVLVGIADYEGSGNDLNYCDDDARDMRASLIASGWPAANITMLIDTQATEAAIRDAVLAMAGRADADDICMFFQSSHGGQGTDIAPRDEPDSMDEYLCTYNINTEQITDDELGLWLSALKTPKYVVLVDACYSGGLLKSVNPRGFSFSEDIAGGSSSSLIGTRDVDDNGSGVVVSSCRDTELSEEHSTLQNGVFAYYVCRGIDTGDADFNTDGWVSAEECYNYARPYVTMLVADQTLDLYDGFPNELNFSQLPTIIASSIPAAKAVFVPTTTKVTVTFRNLVNQASAQPRFRLTRSTGQIVKGTFVWTTAKRTLQFTPSIRLRAGEPYTVTILPGLALDSGVVMPRAESFTFRTGAHSLASLALSGTASATSSGSAQIMVSLSAPATVSGSICNLAGREIAQLSASSLDKGVSTLLWNGKSSMGTSVPAGQYLVKLVASDTEGNSATCLMSLRK